MGRVYRMIEGATRRMLRLRGFRSQYLGMPGSKLHYLEARGQGDLPPVVLLHGLSANSTDLAPMFGAVRKRASRVIVPDLPGHGWSDAPPDGMHPESTFNTFARGLDALLDEPAIIIGNSLGGLAAIRYANHNPEMVRALILLSPGGAGMSRMELRRFMARFRNRNHEEAREFIRLLMVRPPWYRRIVRGMVMYRFRRAPIRELIGHVTHEVLLRPEEIQRLQPPGWIIWGKQDLLQEGQLEFFRTHLPPHIGIHEPDGLGHCPFLDDPRRCNRMVLEFAERTLAPDAAGRWAG